MEANSVELYYKSPRWYAGLLSFLVACAVVCVLAGFGLGFLYGVTSSTTLDDWAFMVDRVFVVTNLVLCLVMLGWIYRIHENLPALGAKNLRMSAVGASLWYLVPFVNIVKSYQGMKDAWNASRQADLQEGLPWSERKGHWLVKAWCACWWSSWLIEKISQVVERTDPTSFESILMDILSLLYLPIVLAGYVLFLFLVICLSRMQDLKWQALQAAKEIHESDETVFALKKGETDEQVSSAKNSG
jgi:hypothetical protein